MAPRLLEFLYPLREAPPRGSATYPNSSAATLRRGPLGCSRKNAGTMSARGRR